MIKAVGLLAAICLLLLFSGCTQKMSIENRLLCLDLTERSYAFVPNCETEEQCFSLLEQRLFNFNSAVFSPAVQSELYYYKNDVALSWLYFNRAKNNISEVHSICNGEKGLSSLSGELNMLMHNLYKAFEFSDKANKRSFTILLLESANLQEQDINLAKEEPLFSDFVLLNNNLNDLASGNSCSSSTYACFYLNEVLAFQQLAERTGFEVRLVNEVTVFDLLQNHKEQVASYAKRAFPIPFLGDVLPAFIVYFNDYIKVSEALDRLQGFPSFQFLQSYNQFMGENNSALQRFSQLMQSSARHRMELLERNKLLEKQLDTKLAASERYLNSLLSKHYASFDENFFPELYAELGQNRGIAAQKYSIQDLSQLSQKGREELSRLRAEFTELQQQDFLGKLTIGKKTFALKELNNEADLLQENLNYLSSEAVSGLLVLCNERIALIEEKLAAAALPKEYLVQTADLRARTAFKLKQFKNAIETEQKLLYCKSAVVEFNRFSLSLQDYQEYRLQEKLDLEQCLSFLKTVFDFPNQIDLSDFTLRFHQLQSIEKPYQDLAQVKRLCSSLSQDLESFLRKHGLIKAIEQDFATASGLLEAFGLINARDSSIASNSELNSFRIRFNNFSSFFSDNALLLDKALPVLSELQQGLQEFVFELEEATTNAIISFAERNYVLSIEQLPGPNPVEVVSLRVSNPFRPIKKPLALEIPFSNSVGSLLNATPNVLGIRSNSRKLLLDLNSLPRSETLAEFSTANIVSVREGLAILSASNEKALFRKTDRAALFHSA